MNPHGVFTHELARGDVDAHPAHGVAGPLRGSCWTWKRRLLVGVVGLGLLGLLLLARWLRPAAEGFGTHQQLGLPPCTMVLMFGKRCPTCGITTSWAYSTRGSIWNALRASVSGTFLAGLAAVASTWLIVSAWRGKWTLLIPTAKRMVAVFALVWLGLVSEWIIRLCWH
ncbi:MAG: DUF2752 domain-containing protein [Thermogutta sp.]